ncbi:MAG: hypothetical protein FLDDKLPJ_02569 [Phycisphaerae bacterium]|nr:hypothetical protein [Phycisphaerae bacterium]
MERDLTQLLDAICSSSSYRLAEEDLAFLARPELRPVRLQLEALKPEMIQQEHGIHSTIVVFGSTRIGPADAARRRFAQTEEALSRQPENADRQRDVRVARSLLEKSRYYDAARRFAQIVSGSCQVQGRREFVVVTGGGPGIMEGANRGAFDVGAKSIGLNITLPHEQRPNPYITPELCFLFHYFAMRKMHFLLKAKALVAFPGGFGTLDELFETLTLIQTGKSPRVPVILFGRGYWERIINWTALVEEGVIDPGDLSLFEFAESPEEAWERICAFYGLESRR